MTYKAMYERSHGARYNEPTEVSGKSYASAADISKLIRRDIKAAIASGELPGSARDYSVRSRSYSGGSAIDVVAKMPDLWVVCPGYKIGSKTEYSYTNPKTGEVSEGWTATGCGNVWCKAGGEHRDSEHASEHKVLGEEGQRIVKILQSFHNAYNHDGSEVMVDYFDKRYWGHAEIERKW